MDSTDKLYVNLQTEDFDPLLNSLFTAASNLIKQTTGKTKYVVSQTETETTTDDIEKDELFKTAVRMLANHWFINRELEVQGSLNKVDFTIETIINHISMCGDYV